MSPTASRIFPVRASARTGSKGPDMACRYCPYWSPSARSSSSSMLITCTRPGARSGVGRSVLGLLVEVAGFPGRICGEGLQLVGSAEPGPGADQQC